MQNSEAGTSNDAVPASGSEYQVFLSFRGPDTRHGFTDFLYHDLLDVGVHVFRDDDELRVGEVIGENLLSAINNSIIYIPIFSRTYASSKWCLRELAHIVDNVSKSEDEKCILPIFLDVEPDDVKLKTPIYSNALLEHERKFSDKIEAWRAALGAVGKIKGWNVTSSQVAIIKLVVKEVLKKLKIKQKSVSEHLVGLDDRIKELTKLLDVNHDDVRLVGIYGMGGIGKTTIAMVVYNQLCSLFGKCCSFLDSIRERSTKEGIVSLQKQLLSDIGGSGTVGDISNSEEGMRRIGQTLSNKKVLVVLDDVDKKVLINNLIGNSKLYRGSRIIITTRDTSVLEVEGFKCETQQYEMLKMDDGPALQLFGRHAFSGDFPLDNYLQLSSDIVSTTGGLPLAIQVIGSFLNGKHREIWEETLEKLRNVPAKEILEKLRISYDDLEEPHKQIFLDIACFFVNKNKTDAIYMWTDCRFYPKGGIQVLTDRCLIKILYNDKLWMHDQLIALGRQIVREDSPDDPNMHSRLWIAKEALQIIRNKKTKSKVQALEIFTDGTPIEIRNEDFERLPNLRFLHLESGTYIGDFAKCHPKLRWFSWSNPYSWNVNKFDLDFRASNLHLDELVVFKVDHIDCKDDSKAWDLIKKARNLKVLYIGQCDGITSIPDISGCSALERLTLHNCFKLKTIESSIGNLQSLIELKIKTCFNFMDLPKKVGALVKLKRFFLNDCERLTELPSSFGNLTSLTELDLSGTKITELPNSIVQLKSLRILRFPLRGRPFLDYSSHDWQLPSGIGTLVNLEELNLCRHYGLKGEIPVGIGNLSSLKKLNLGGTCICRIPKTINKLHQLQTLNLSCENIQELPELPTGLTCLILRSPSLLSVPNLSKLTNLVKLILNDCSYHRSKSNLISGFDLRWIGNLSRLEWLELHLQTVSAPQELASLSHLKELVLTNLDLKPLVQLPSSYWSGENLLTLNINSCEEYIPLEKLLRLENYTVQYCIRLERLSIPSELRKLRKVIVLLCSKLVEIQVVGLSKSLEILEVSYCESLTRISGLPDLKNLKRLQFKNCITLANVEGVNELDSLRCLVVRSCNSLTRLIDASCTKLLDYCIVDISYCAYPIKDARDMPVKHYREILSNKDSFTIRFHLGVKMSSGGWFGSVCGIEREKEGVDPDSLTYEGLIAEVKNFGFHFKRMWHVIPHIYLSEIKSDEHVKYMLGTIARRGEFFFHLFVEGEINSGREGEYREEIMEILRKEGTMWTDVHSDEDREEWCRFLPLELDSNFAPMGGESGTHGTSSVVDFELERGNAECFEATASVAKKDLDCVKKQVELHKEPKDEETITSKRCGEDIFLNTLNKEKRDKTIETDRVPAKTGRGSATSCASNSGRGPAERGRGRDTTSSSRNGKGLRLGRDAASALGKGSRSNLGRDIASGSRSSATSSLRRARGSTPGKGTNLSSGRGVTLSLGRGSSSGMDTTKMGIASSSKRGITPSSPSSATLSTGRGRGSTSGKGTAVSSGRGTNSSLGRGITRMGTSLRSGTNKGSSSAKAEPQTSRSREEQ